MANQNLFEKYGIKEVADVTFYRIERKNETYESLREIAASSILKGALEIKTVYPLDEETGISTENGFDAYVFTDAEILHNVEFEHEDGAVMDAHEYSYAEQILMLFAKNQNLITKGGTRYAFTNSETDPIFGSLEFIDTFALAPYSTEKAVICAIPGQDSETTYEIDGVKNVIDTLTTSFKAKAYDVSYSDYAELIVEDEMGWFKGLDAVGGSYTLNGGVVGFGTNDDVWTDDSAAYATWANAKRGTDLVLSNIEVWNDGVCASINDAIMALRKKYNVLDNSSLSAAGVSSIKGGYLVNSEAIDTAESDLDDAAEIYTYTGGTTSKYSLAAVMEAIATLTGDIEVSSENASSNRAIYVGVNGDMVASAGAHIYIMKNVNAKKLATDTAGIFKFQDKKGNTLYYQDKVFAGKETLALVALGKEGLVFVVNRYGTRNIDKVAWMVNDGGYVNDTQAKTLVKNGLLHIVDITIEGETFEATCTVNGLKVRKIEKRVNRYVPVLFLDTLKVSTLEQTAETSYATGGKGNANLIGWDFNKEITLTLQDALYSPASMSAMLGSYEGSDFTNGVKETKKIDRMEKCTAKRSFIVPAGNSKGVPSEGENSAQAVYIDMATMQPYQDGAPIAEGELFLKWTRSVAYADNSIGNTIEISADKFPGTYKIVGDTYARAYETGEDQRFQFVVHKAKMSPESNTITLEADGEPVVFDMTMTVLRPENGVMVSLIQYDVVENTEENDGSTMVKDTENLNLLDDAEMFRVNTDTSDEQVFIGATEY